MMQKRTILSIAGMLSAILLLAFGFIYREALAAYLIHKDSWSFESVDELYGPSIVKVVNSPNIYAVAYQAGSNRPGYVKTFAMQEDPNDGTIIKIIKDTYVFNDPGQYARITHVENNVYAVVFTGGSSKGWIQTFTINPDGTIPQNDWANPLNPSQYLDKKVLDVSTYTQGKTIDITRLAGASGNKFVLAYGSNGSDGLIRTVDISSAGTITFLNNVNVSCSVPTGVFSFDCSSVAAPRIASMPFATNDRYIVIYGDDLKVLPISISTNGLTVAPLGPIVSLESGAAVPSKPIFISTQGNDKIFAVAYRGSGNKGRLRTFKVNMVTGVASSIGNIIFEDTIKSANNLDAALDLQSLGNNKYGVAYEAIVIPDPENPGNKDYFARFKIYSIDATGNITTPENDYSISLTTVGSTNAAPVIMPIPNNPYYMIIYSGSGEDGIIQTLVPSAYVDCGLHVWDGTGVVVIACEPPGSVTSKLRIWNGSDIYGVKLVELIHPDASKIHIWTGSTVMALMKMP